MADLSMGRLGLAVLCLGLAQGPALAQGTEQIVGKVGAWDVRCADPGTEGGVCYLAQGIAQTDETPAAEIVAESGFVAARVPANARLAVPMTIISPSGSFPLTWQSCGAETCEAVLPLDKTLAASLAGDAKLRYEPTDRSEPIEIGFSPDGLALALPLLDEIARHGLSAIPVAQQKSAPADPRFRIAVITTTPSEYFDEAEIEAITAAFVGRAVKASQVGLVAQSINELYAARGIRLAQAVVETVDVASGRIGIRLIEAHVESIAYQSHNMSDAYLAFRLGFGPGMLADTRLLERELNRLALTDGVTASVGVEAGSAEGLTALDISFTEPKAYWAYAGLDNFGADSTGLTRLSLGGGIRSLSGWNDPLSVDIVKSEGAASIAAAYSRTITPEGTRLGVTLDAASSTSITSPEVTDLSRGIELQLSHPMLLEIDRSWTVGGAVYGFAEEGAIAGAPLIDQSGVGLRLSSNESISGAGWRVALGQSLNVLNWDDAIAGDDGQRFASATFTGGASATLNNFAIVSADVAAQFALFGESGPSRAQFGVSGPFGVRGYSSELSKDDSGAYLRLQVSPAQPLEFSTLSVSPFGFLDYGRAWDASGAYQDPMLSVGFGANWQFDTMLSGQLWVARPLRDANGYTADETVIRASLVATF